MQRLIVELTACEREAIAHYLHECKLSWGLFWRQVLRVAERNAQWLARHARRTRKTVRKNNETHCPQVTTR